MREKLEIDSRYKMASGYKVLIISEGKLESGKKFFIGENFGTQSDQKFFKFDETGMPFGAPNSQIYSKI